MWRREAQTSWPCLPGIELLIHRARGKGMRSVGGFLALGRNCSFWVGTEGSGILVFLVVPAWSRASIMLRWEWGGEGACYGSDVTDTHCSY